jgi:NAD(P)H-quinone oxidoreductase subunit 6
MLVNKRQAFTPMARTWLSQIVTGGVCAGLFALLTVAVLNTPWALSDLTPIGEGAIIEIGKHFFSDYLLPFELASVLLLIALIGAIVLARREFIPDVLSGQPEPDALQLPERPRELVSVTPLNDVSES